MKIPRAKIKCDCGEPIGNIILSDVSDWHDLRTTKDSAFCGECERFWWVLTDIYTHQAYLVKRIAKEASR